jgi:hypothetical protein
MFLIGAIWVLNFRGGAIIIYTCVFLIIKTILNLKHFRMATVDFGGLSPPQNCSYDVPILLTETNLFRYSLNSLALYS